VGARSLAFGLVLACAASASAQVTSLDPGELWRERQAEWEAARFWIALLATVLLAAGAALRMSGRDRWLGRSRNAVLIALVLATLAAWWHPYRGSLRTWLHAGDSFHYYVGAKYFDELGYSRLYDCMLVADFEAGQTDLRETHMRNLSTNRIETAARVLDRPGLCKRHFSGERWQEFTEDVAWFRKRMGRYHWRRLRTDHGYNPPPTWTLVGGGLANTLPVGRTSFFILTGLDPLLLWRSCSGEPISPPPGSGTEARSCAWTGSPPAARASPVFAGRNRWPPAHCSHGRLVFACFRSRSWAGSH
jgi:hypothetical protein